MGIGGGVREVGFEGCGMERGRDRAEIQLSPLSFLTWRGRPLGPSSTPFVPPRPLFSSKWPGYTHIHRHTQSQMSHGAASVARREDSVRINHACPSQVAISADIVPGQPSGLEIVYVQYLRSTNVKFGCRLWFHWQRWNDGLQKCAKPIKGVR